MTKQRLFFALRVAAWAAVAGCVVVFLLKIDRNQVRLGFEAPTHVGVFREEIAGSARRESSEKRMVVSV